MRRRTLILRILVTLGLLLMVGRLAWFQVVKAEEVLTREDASRLQREALMPVRGAIVDRSGRYLAVSVPLRNVVASPFHIGRENFAMVAKGLAPLVGKSTAELEALFEENAESQFLPLAKGIDLATAGKVQELRLPGIALVETTQRTYPQGDTANQLIGYLDSEGKGAYGLEAQYEDELRGKEGYVRAEMTYDNAPIEGTIKSQMPAEPGLKLTATIDAFLQQTFDEALDEVIAKEDAKRALAIAMDVETGEILAMSMRPGADLSDRSTWLKPDGSLDVDRLTNWAVTPLPPGSSFKTVTTAIALEENLIDPTTTIYDSGHLEIDGWTIYNWDRSVPVEPKPMTIAELLQTSSNIGLIQVGQRIPHEKFQRYLEIFGFTDPTGLDFPHESAATGLWNWEEKRDIDWANMYIGQHLEVTPLQLLRAVSAIVNDGKLVQPHLIREARNDKGEVVWSASTEPLRYVVSKQTSAEMRELLVSVIEKAYTLARVPGYTAGGKTGTAQKFENGKEKERGLGDFVGFAPASDPRVAMFILVDEPKPPGYGGTIAAPLFAKLMPHALRTLGVAPDIPPEDREAEESVSTSSAAKVAVPDVRHLPLSWAEQRLRDAGLAVKTSGEGWLVAEQSVQPGQGLEAGGAVELRLEAQGPGGVKLPDFRGLTLVDASRLAAELGLSLKQAGGSGFVVEQSPAVGVAVEPGSVVSLKLSDVRP